MSYPDHLDIPPLTGAHGSVNLPGSKSISNRVLLLAMLCEGDTLVKDLLDSDDTRVMLAALAQLGCTVQTSSEGTRITGLGRRLPTANNRLHLGNAGTAMRPLTAALALLGQPQELTGVARMQERPIGDLVDALRQLGCAIDYLGNHGYPPLALRGLPQGLNIPPAVKVRGDVSSQFLTALLMALPIAAQRLGRDVVIEVEGELISKPYIDITLHMLAQFGIQVQREGWQRFTIPAHARYQSPGTVHVEADASSASYFIAIGAIANFSMPTRAITIFGIGENAIQGDVRFVDAARAMGAQVESGPNWLRVRRAAECAQGLRAIALDCNHIPDAAMTLAVMALYANGTTRLTNIASWRVKETDRIAAMATELRKLGASVVEGADFIEVTPPAPGGWRSADIRTYDDHRMAMCLSLAAFNPAGCTVRIQDPGCVAKTFPEYFERLFATVTTDTHRIPVICIDGPTASGKGTLSSRVAQALGFAHLDSGALYRIVGLAASRAGLPLDATGEAQIAALTAQLDISFKDGRAHLAGEDVDDAIRAEAAGMNASKVSALPAVRSALVDLQHRFRRLPGLVADGRDMGTVIFPDAPLKVYLTASAAQRAVRRHKQLMQKGISATLDTLRADLEARDARDMNRAVAPLKPAEDATLLDNSDLSIDQSVDLVLSWWGRKQPGLA